MGVVPGVGYQLTPQSEIRRREFQAAPGAMRQNSAGSNPPNANCTACYVGGISIDLQESELKSRFESHGIQVKNVRIIRRRVGPGIGPYAFVNFYRPGDAARA